MGSNESHFNVSLNVRVSNLVFTPSQPLRLYQGEIVRDKVSRQCPQTTNFEEKGEPKRIRTEVSAYQPHALPLGQTGSQLAMKQAGLIRAERGTVCRYC